MASFMQYTSNTALTLLDIQHLADTPCVTHKVEINQTYMVHKKKQLLSNCDNVFPFHLTIFHLKYHNNSLRKENF
jgi:hypothetical protein